MREIKYQAFLKEAKIIKPVQAIYFPSGSNSGKELIIMDCWFSFDEVELLEFTGLKDKNGREIHEGDIVTEKFDNVYDIGKVVFNDGAFWVKFADDDYLLIGCDSEETEVIGNIYEDPQLLEVQHERN